MMLKMFRPRLTLSIKQLMRVLTIFFPVKTVRLHANDKPWMNDRVKNLINQRQKAFAEGDKSTWTDLKNRVIKEIKKAKAAHNVNKVRKLQKTEPGRWHREIRYLANMKKTEITIQVPDVAASDHVSVANAINQHLASFSNSQQPMKLADLPAYLPSPVPPPQVHPWEIFHDLSKLSASKAGGPDNIPPRLLKEFAYELSQPVSDIINASLSQSLVPTQWKEANVIPIPKQTPPSIDKLRPVSLTPCLAKVAEGRVCKWIVDAIQPHVDHRQFGNQKGLSTTHCLIDVYHHLVSGAENSKNVGTLVLTDFSKAFDLIDHKIAVTKLLKLGVPPSLVQWVVNFLSGRKQRVKYKNTYSEWIELHGGVPQGTVIGPIAFLGMINDALTEFDTNKMKVWKYVDDLTIGENRAFDDITEVQQSLDSLHEWSVSNKLKLNPSKCQAMCVYFGKNNSPDIELRISDHSLAVVQKVKLLGVIIQEDLKWQGQVDNMYSKANGKMFMLRKLKEACLDTDEITHVYKGYMRPVLEYAAPYGTQVSLRVRRPGWREFRSVYVSSSLARSIQLTPTPLQLWILSLYTLVDGRFARSLPPKYRHLKISPAGSLPLNIHPQ
jgi:hypothetical protein